MNIAEAKNISLADYLQSIGIAPCKHQGNNLWYYSPFRKETEPSFKVNLSRNEWYDFGMGKGGNIIDFTMEHQGTDSISHALQIISGEASKISTNSFSFRPSESLPGFTDIDIQSLTNPALLQYLKERNIHIPFAEQGCKEIHFTTNGKRYFAIGFENELGGYELRNRYFQGCLSPKGITTIRNGNEACYVFEGFMDYLSYLTIQKTEQKKFDVVVLNSVANLQKAMDILKSHKTIYTCLDNDEAGRKTTELIQSVHSTVYNRSTQYNEYKDLNDYLCGKKQILEKKKSKGFKV